MKEKEKAILRVNFVRALFEADVKAPKDTVPDAMADSAAMTDTGTDSAAPATDATGADAGTNGTNGTTDALNAPTAPAGTDSPDGTADPSAASGEAPGGSDDTFMGGGGSGGGSGGAGFGGGGSPSGEEETTTPKEPEQKDDPVSYVVDSVKNIAKTNQDVPTILKTFKSALQYNVKSREQIGTILQKLETEKNPSINAAVARLKDFLGSKNIQEKKMVKINENDIRKLVNRRLDEMEAKKKAKGTIIAEQANISAVRNLIELARGNAFEFEANFIKELGLMQLDEMDGNSQKVFVDAMKTLHSKFAAAVIDCIKDIENLPKPPTDQSTVKK